MILKILYYIFIFCFSTIAFCQDLGQIGKAKLFKLTGGVAANTVLYEGDANREPFTYFLSGNINLNISGVYNIPFSFSYSNQEFQNSNPFKFNRLSIHPSYKWVTTHIGDVNMTFSPYTLSGHQFTGFGVDLTLNEDLKISAMYGRLLKASEYVENDPNSNPAYKRLGYGIKTSYNFEKFSVGAIFFMASDDKTSIENPIPVEKELYPKDNVVVSLEGKVKLFDKGELKAEYASSAITENTEASEKENTSSILSSLLDNNITTQHYKAYNLGFTYPIAKGTVGVGYEYIDPDYRTLGAYFFNNDLENITLNATQTLFQDKVNVSFNAGLQRDDLDNKKSTQLQRVVSAVTIGYTPTEKLNISGGYSNFQSYTNIKNQFDYINEVAQADNLDTLDFQQVSQNANLNVNYILRDTETRKDNFNIAISYQNSLNKQGGQTTEGGNSNFYNASTAYTLGYPILNLTIATALNVNYNTIGINSSTTFGPSISVGKQFFDKKVKTNGSISYNQSHNNGEKQGDVANIRLGGAYTYKKKHNFRINILTQFRNSTSSSQNFTATFGYNYTFDSFNPKLKFSKKPRKPKVKKSKKRKSKGTEILQFKYKDSLYKGTMDEIDIRLAAIEKHPHFDHIPEYKKEELAILRLEVVDERKSNEYKVKALTFLRELYSYEDFLAGYHQLVFEMLQELRKDMLRLDYAFEKAFVKAKIAVDNHSMSKKTEEQRKTASSALKTRYEELQKNSEVALARLIGHRWTLPIIQSYNTIEKVENPDKFLREVMELEKDNIFKMVDHDKSEQEIQLYMITQIIDFYLKKSLEYTDPDKFDLKYIEKN